MFCCPLTTAPSGINAHVIALLDELRLDRASTSRAHATFERLTNHEALVLGSLIDGLSAEEIAESHFVALTTVRSQIRAVLQKLGVRSQLAAVARVVASHTRGAAQASAA